jgi:hypothetical protein
MEDVGNSHIISIEKSLEKREPRKPEEEEANQH